MTLLDAKGEARLDRAIRVVGVAALLLVAAGVLMAAFHAPLLPGFAEGGPHAAPLGQKIFYTHVPAAFAAYLSFLILAVSSYLYLGKERPVWDAFSSGAAEVGVLFAGVTLFTGSMWGHLEWGADSFGYWSNEDAKLVLTLIMFLIFVGYLVLRRQIDDPRRRGRIAAVYALLGFAVVPLSYVAQRVWQTRHPTVFGTGDADAGLVTPGVAETFFVNIIALWALALFMVLVRFRLEVRRRNKETERLDRHGEVGP